MAALVVAAISANATIASPFAAAKLGSELGEELGSPKPVAGSSSSGLVGIYRLSKHLIHLDDGKGGDAG